MADIDNPTPAMIDAFMASAHTAAICEIAGMLIESGVLNQGFVVARFERLSNSLMKKPGGKYSAPVVDIIRNYAAGEQERVPS